MTIENLEIQITSDTEKAVGALESLVKKIDELDTRLSSKLNAKAFSDSLNGFTEGISKFKTSLQLIDFNTIAEKLGQLNTSLGTLDETVVNRYIKLAEVLDRISKIHLPAGEVGHFVKNMNSVKTAKNDVQKFANTIKNATKGLKGFTNQFYRLSVLKALRSAINATFSGIREGMENAYNFSKVTPGLASLATAMDNLSTKTFSFTNQVGAAANALISALAPILIKIIELATKAADAIAQVFSVLSGSSTYAKATDYTKQWGKETAAGAAAAKEWKNALMGFDELNVLPEQSDGGGGGGGAASDFGSMFEKANVSEWAKKFESLIPILDFVKDHILEVAVAIGSLLIGYKLFGIAGALQSLGTSGILSGLATLGETIMFVAGVFIFALGAVDAFKNGLNKDNIATMIFGIAVAATALGLAFGVPAAAITILVGSFALLGIAIYQFKKDGEMTNEILAAIALAITGIGVAFALLTGSWIPLVGAAIIGLGIVIWKKWNEIIEFIDSTPFGHAVLEAIKTVTHAVKEFFDFIGDIFGKIADWYKWLSEKVNKYFGIDTQETIKQFGGASAIAAEETAFNTSRIGNASADMASAFVGNTNTVLDSMTALATSSVTATTNSNGSSIGFFGNISRSLGQIYRVGAYASGGFPTEGQLFLANENGAEMVGSIDGRTAVANNQQIVEAIRSGVYDAVMSANRSSSGNNNVNVYLDGKQITNAVTKRQGQAARAMGV